MNAPVLEISGVTKNYHALRPLRIEHLQVGPGEHVAILGLDQPAAETLINLVTGAMLPDQGRIAVLGRSTADVENSDEWLTLVDRFGIVSERAVLLESLSVLQNLAMPFSLDIEPIDEQVRPRAEALGREVGFGPRDWERRIGDLAPVERLRARLGRALALDPAIVLMEHPSAALGAGEFEAAGKAVRSVLEGRIQPDGHKPASISLTANVEFARAVANRVLSLDPATGRLSGQRRRWFLGGRTASL